jgi:REP element-mobilizing transposase RayT
MPWVKVWIHFVWSTKNREPNLTDNIRQKVFQHIRKTRKKGESIWILSMVMLTMFIALFLLELIRRLKR